jgi:hypothetical protein
MQSNAKLFKIALKREEKENTGFDTIWGCCLSCLFICNFEAFKLNSSADSETAQTINLKFVVKNKSLKSFNFFPVFLDFLCFPGKQKFCSQSF